MLFNKGESVGPGERIFCYPVAAAEAVSRAQSLRPQGRSLKRLTPFDEALVCLSAVLDQSDGLSLAFPGVAESGQMTTSLIRDLILRVPGIMQGESGGVRRLWRAFKLIRSIETVA